MIPLITHEGRIRLRGCPVCAADPDEHAVVDYVRCEVPEKIDFRFLFGLPSFIIECPFGCFGVDEATREAAVAAWQAEQWVNLQVSRYPDGYRPFVRDPDYFGDYYASNGIEPHPSAAT